MELRDLEELVGQEAAQQILQRHQQEMQQLRLEHALCRAVERAGGRNEKAVRALLDRDALAQAEDPAAAAAEAVAQLKRENPWLFMPAVVSSPGTGAMTVTHSPSMADVGNMSMAEYRRFRQGK